MLLRLLGGVFQDFLRRKGRHDLILAEHVGEVVDIVKVLVGRGRVVDRVRAVDALLPLFGQPGQLVRGDKELGVQGAVFDIFSC